MLEGLVMMARVSEIGMEAIVRMAHSKVGPCQWTKTSNVIWKDEIHRKTVEADLCRMLCLYRKGMNKTTLVTWPSQAVVMTKGCEVDKESPLLVCNHVLECTWLQLPTLSLVFGATCGEEEGST